ncbi:MAG: Do family serine endopeptidase [Brevundimonas sp.]|jgi:serine protease Do|uniref:Do family serine endopeptidase n=1 Tax=Brevundimonas sp. TaxID=1871086 RepID=UPI00391B2A8B
MLKRKEFIVGAAVGLMLAAAATAGGVIQWPGAQAETPFERPSGESAGGNVTPSAAGVVFAPPPGAPLSFADIFDRVAPAVVQIDVRQRAQARRGTDLFPFPFPFMQPQPRTPEGEAPQGPGPQGSGSGFFISADGYIVTNNHVIENAEEITVRLSDERRLTARVIGTDPDTDLAVLKVEGNNFPFVEFSTEAQPRVGDWVIAVGNPFGLGGTATAGIVSARGRNLNEAYVDFIQIDAPINRGNSGGPTFDIYGRVIGVNTAIFSPNGFSVGIGFAIPSDVASRITSQLIQQGGVERGYLGVEISNIVDEYRTALGLPEDLQGAFVGNVTPGGPAEQGGLQRGDIITAVDGEAVNGSIELTRRVGQARPGQSLRLDVLRDGRRLQVSVRSGTRPSRAELQAQSQTPTPETSGRAPAPTGEVVLGMTVTPLTSQLRSRYGIAGNEEGLVITGVSNTSQAGRIGVEPGMVILRANYRNIRTVADLRAEIAEARRANRSNILLFIRTRNGTQPVALELGDS